MKMIDLLKKTLAFGMGAAAYSAEKIKQFADDMVARGEMTTEEAGKFVDDMMKRAEDEKRAVQDWMREQMSKMLQGAGAVDAARVDALEQRIAAIEEKLGISPEDAISEAGTAGEH
ncbi:MAG: hypothetical protein N3B12_00630 [Armatimonadetes bacterium]|nr:hypothetical protein [Armatimonadota bacterium]